jgi:Trk K+ transport system NAD-binding subunit
LYGCDQLGTQLAGNLSNADSVVVSLARAHEKTSLLVLRMRRELEPGSALHVKVLLPANNRALWTNLIQ